jgi:hypothetical protein
MGRIEAPIDGSGSLARFAADLRDLRRDAGNPPYRHLARTAHYSAATLSQAAAGRTWPTLPVTLAYVRACGGDDTVWRQRWEQEQRQPTVLGDGAPGTGAPASAPPPRWAIAAVACAVAAAAVATLALSVLTRQPPAVSGSSPSRSLSTSPVASPIRVRDGQDPYIAGCGPDQQELERRDIAWPDGTHYGELVLFYSAACQAVWGYVYGPNSPDWAVHIVATRPQDGTTAPSSFQGKARPNSWGNLLSARNSCVAVEAYVVRGGRRGAMAMTSCFQDGGPVIK